MTTKYFCDLCGLEVPTPQSLETLKLGERTLAEICYSCRTQIQTILFSKKQETEKMIKEAKGNMPKAKSEQGVSQEAGKSQPEAGSKPQPGPAPGSKEG